MQPKLYQIWIGNSPRHWYIDLCLDTVRHHNPDVQLLDDQALQDMLGPWPAEITDPSLYVVHKVDWLRKKLLATTGGMYVDADFICWHPLDFLVQLATWWDAVAYKEWHGTGWMDNFCIGRQGSPILEDAAENALQSIRYYGSTSLPWLSTNAWAMNTAMNKHAWGRVLQIPTHLITPVSLMNPAWFAATWNPEEDLRQFACFGFMTSWHSTGDWLKGTYSSAKEFLEGPSRLAQLMRIGLGLA